MPAPDANAVNAGKVFRQTPLLEREVPTFKSAPAISPNPFTGLGQTDPYAKAHHLVGEAPTTVLEATRVNPVD
jgi:hypothetical protein